MIMTLVLLTVWVDILFSFPGSLSLSWALGFREDVSLVSVFSSLLSFSTLSLDSLVYPYNYIFSLGLFLGPQCTSKDSLG